MNKHVDSLLNDIQNWKAELTQLRKIALDCLLDENVKWGVPCYTFRDKNIVLIHGFKEYCSITFFKGALLQDTTGLLVKPGQNTQAGRQMRFTSVKEILTHNQTIKAYIHEAIELEKAGLKVERSAAPLVSMPEEFQVKLNASKALKKAFESLTPGRQRAYLMFFADAKQAATRIARIEKLTPKILIGKGMLDCTCGLSKRMPSCDGSHRIQKEQV